MTTATTTTTERIVTLAEQAAAGNFHDLDAAIAESKARTASLLRLKAVFQLPGDAAATRAAIAASPSTNGHHAANRINGKAQVTVIVPRRKALPAPATSSPEPSSPPPPTFTAAPAYSTERRRVIAQLILKNGPTKAAEIIKSLSWDPKLVYNATQNHEWFEKQSGVVHLSTAGQQAVRDGGDGDGDG